MFRNDLVSGDPSKISRMPSATLWPAGAAQVAEFSDAVSSWWPEPLRDLAVLRTTVVGTHPRSKVAVELTTIDAAFTTEDLTLHAEGTGGIPQPTPCPLEIVGADTPAGEWNGAVDVVVDHIEEFGSKAEAGTINGVEEFENAIEDFGGQFDESQVSCAAVVVPWGLTQTARDRTEVGARYIISYVDYQQLLSLQLRLGDGCEMHCCRGPKMSDL